MAGLDIISPSKQKEWGLLAVANFVLGGAGMGFYLVNVTTTIINSHFLEQRTSISHDSLSLFLVTLGLVCVAIETGRPFRGYYIFNRLGKSWISREVTAFAIFFSAVVLNHFFPHWTFTLIAAAGALSFMVIQGFIVSSGRAVAAWNTAMMPFIFLSSGLASGAGVALLFALSDGLLTGGHTLLKVSILSMIFSLAMWLFYQRWYRSVSFQSQSQSPELNRPVSKMNYAIVFGHIIPVLLLFLLWQIQGQHAVGGTLTAFIVGLSGVAINIGVSVQKASILISAGYTRGVSLTFTANSKGR